MKTDTIILWGGVAVALVGAVVTAIALWWDWARRARHGRTRRCPRCWYDMSATAGLTCPECGRTARSERRLLRSRRRWRWAVVGFVVLVAGAGGAAWPRVSRMDWVKAAPGFVLVRLAEDTTPIPPAPPAPPTGFAGGISLYATPSARPPAAPPPTPQAARQARIVNEIWDRYRDGRLSIGQKREVWRRRYPKDKPPVTFEGRSSWPGGIPLRVAVVTDFDGPFPCTIRLTGRFEGASTVVVYSGAHRSSWGGPWAGQQTDWLQVVGTPPAGLSEVLFDVVIEEGGKRIWAGVASHRVKVGGSIGDVLPASRDAGAGLAIAEALNRSARLSADGRWLIVERPSSALPGGLSVAMRAELVRDGKVSAVATVVWPAGSEGSRPERRGARDEWYAVAGDVASAALAAANPAGWRLRVVADGEAALRDMNATSYWAGELEMALDAAAR